MLKGPWGAEASARFLDTFFYGPEAFLVDEVLSAENGTIEARLDTTRTFAYGSLQRGDPKLHPRHVSGGDLLMVTGNLGCLHAYFFHGCRWDEGWVGFGGKLYRADFKSLALIGPPLSLKSFELQKKLMSNRAIIRFGFEFHQGDRLVYVSEQSAIFTKNFEIPT